MRLPALRGSGTEAGERGGQERAVVEPMVRADALEVVVEDMDVSIGWRLARQHDLEAILLGAVGR